MLLANFRRNVRDLVAVLVDEMLAHLPGAAVVIDETTRALCVVPGRPHTATDGRLCRPHLEELGVWLHDIDDEAARLDAAPSMAIRLGEGGGGSLASQRAPVVIDAVAFMDRRTSAPGRHAGPVCYRCPILASRSCACSRANPAIAYWTDGHRHGCPIITGHPSCMRILADRDEPAGASLQSVFGVIHGWADRVREERKIKVATRPVIDRLPPVGDRGPIAVDRDGVAGTARDAPVPLTVATECALLIRQLDWIARQPWVLVMRAQLADLRDQLRRHNRNEDDRPLTGWCYRLVDGEECGGRLLPAAPVHSTGPDDDDVDGPHRPKAIACERNPAHRWEGHDLARLSLILERQRREEERQRRADAAAARPPVPPAAAERRLHVVSTAGQGSRIDPVLAAQALEEQQRAADAHRRTPTATGRTSAP